MADRLCTHCGLVVPHERRSSPYCCAGCEAVNALLQAEGLTRFYDLGGRASGAVGAVPKAPPIEWLPELEARHSAGSVTRLVLDVQGLRCAACVWLLQTLWKRIPGGRDLRIAPSLGQATLTYDLGSGAAEAFVQRAGRLGYPMAPPSRTLSRDSSLLVRLGIASAIAMNAMILAVSLYFGLDTAVADAGLRALFGWVLLGLGTASVVLGGPVFFKAALAGLRVGVVHMDLPISLGILMAWAGSVYGQLTGGATYFDTVAIFVAFMLGGRFLQQRTLAQSRDLVLADDGAEHLRARRIAGDRVELVPVHALQPGDQLLLAPGDLVPVRARPSEVEASFSLDWINGESEPRSFAVGEEVPAGAFQAGRRAVRAEVVADYAGSGLSHLLTQDPIDRENTHGRVRFWSLLGSNYALGVLLAAALGALGWAFFDASRSLPVAVSILVITCPCAMGIATPLAFHLALAMLRRRGVFVRTRSLLDKVLHVRKVVFDKTGTVTFGGLRATANGKVPAAALPVLATMAASSNHPVSQAVLQSLGERPFDATLAVVEVPGKGLECVVAGHSWRLGSRSFCGLGVAAAREGSEPAGRECVFARDGEAVATFTLEEDFRAGIADEVAALQARGLEVHLLSGDRPDRVREAATRLGIDPAQAHGGMSPADKAAAIGAIDRHDAMMIGDGINDAPAFQAAFCAGTPAMDRPVLPARSDFCFRGAQAGAVRSLFDVAGLHAAVVRTNLTLALAYNSTTLVLCFAAAMTPVLCAVLMPLSSIALVLHTSVRFARARRVA
ncbi:MAG: heavy metal translocating P-type ATPase metal-binding domain-containing protein [Planctomycetes bacterium]|nr:heavy metal translocating P-type ATPase metal-binding domain-containing protein [Planctomycetota bacterium]